MEQKVFISLPIEDFQTVIIDCVNSCLNNNKHINNTTKEEQEKLLNVEQTAQFLNLSIATIYSKVSKNELPFMKRSKRLYFSSTELLEYLKQGRRKSNNEIRLEVDEYLSNSKKK